MTCIDKLISIAEAEVGYLEKKSNSQLDDKTANAGSNNYTKYGAWYSNGILQAQAWCAMFISWLAYMAGLLNTVIPLHASCYAGVSWFKSKGRWKDKAGYTPQRGDIAYFSSTTYPNGGAHVGLVYDCDGKTVYTIEGNTSGGSTLISNGGGVCKKSYTLGYDKIYGYATPAYPDSATSSGTSPSASASTASDPNLAVGDIVDFTGTMHYVSSSATTGVSCKPGKAKVTSIVKGAKHPYHLIKTTDGTSTVCGWVDAADITTGFAVGNKVKVAAGAKDYNGRALVSYVYNTVYTILQIDSNRVVIGLGTAITAAVHTDNLVKQ